MRAAQATHLAGKNLNPYGNESKFFKAHSRAYAAQIKIASGQLNKAKSQYSTSMNNLDKINNAEIIDFSGGVGGVDIGGESVASLAKKRAIEVKRVIESIKTPFAKHVDRSKNYEAMLKAGELTKKQHDLALKNSVEQYKNGQKSIDQNSKTYQLYSESLKLRILC